jgi:WD40 repeat protein
LLAQAELQRSSGRAGQRFQTLDLIRRATENRFGGKVASESRVALRTEVAAALALPDLRSLARWPAHISHFENEFDFTPDLERYAMGISGGGLAIFATADHKKLWQVPGATNDPPVEFRLSSDGRWAAATFQDGHAELHLLSGDETPRKWPAGRSGRSHFAFAPSADRVAVAAATEGTLEIVQVISLESGAVEAEIAHRGTRAMAFDSTGHLLALGGEGLTVRDLRANNDLWSIRLPNDASAVAWSPNGRLIALALDHRAGLSDEAFEGYPILLLEAATGRRETVLTEVSTRIESLAFHPDGGSVAAATWQSDLLWISVRPDRSQITAQGAQRSLRFAADGKRLAYAPSKEELGILEVATPTVLREWELESAPAKGSFTLTMSKDSRWVAAGTDAGIQLWDAKLRKQVGVLPVPPQAWWISVLFAPGDEAVYYSGSQFGVWRAQLVETNELDGTTSLRFGRTELLSESKGFVATGFAADGRSLIVGENRRGSHNERTPPTMWLWEEGDRARARKLVENFPLVGYRMLTGGRWAVSTDLIEPDLWVWNPQTGKRERSLGIALPVNSEPAPNGRWLVTRTRDEFVVWEVDSWRALARWSTPPTEQLGSWMVISPDSRLLATTSTDGRIMLRSMPSGTELITLIPPRTIRLGDWKFTPDSRRLYVLPSTGRMFEWDLKELRQELAKLKLDW